MLLKAPKYLPISCRVKSYSSWLPDMTCSLHPYPILPPHPRIFLVSPISPFCSSSLLVPQTKPASCGLRAFAPLKCPSPMYWQSFLSPYIQLSAKMPSPDSWAPFLFICLPLFFYVFYFTLYSVHDIICVSGTTTRMEAPWGQELGWFCSLLYPQFPRTLLCIVDV